MPLVPAYALTIHKAQGMTINTPLYINLENMWRSELLYVALSRVTDDSLLILFNPPISHMYTTKLVPNRIVNEYLNNGHFEQFGFRMVIDDQNKQMSIGKRPDTDLFKLNQIDFDFETAEKTSKHGLVCHNAYYNHIVHWKNGNKIASVTYEDYIEKPNKPNVNGSNGNDVA